MTLVELFAKFPNDSAAERWFTRTRWPAGDPACPHCGSLNVLSGAQHKTMPYRCRDCRKRFSIRTGTVMEASNLGFQIWAIAIYLLTTRPGISSHQLARDLGIAQKSAWHLEFTGDRTEYEGVAAEGVTETTVEAEALQRRTTVLIEPADADGDDTNGHQLALEGVTEITVTVTSADGSRTRVYARIHRSKLDRAGCRAGGEFGGRAGVRQAAARAERSEELSLSAAQGR